jgi:Uma2 family endonuclease
LARDNMQTATQKISALEYEKLPEGSPSQLIDGEIVLSPSPSAMHQLIVGDLYTLLKSFVGENKLGTVIISPIDVVLRETEVYQPNIIFISRQNKDIIQDKIKGVPDLVVEVLSPKTAYYDLVHKKNIYEETGVKEFWAVDGEGKSVEMYENIDGKFILFSKARTSGSVESKLLSGFRIDIEELFKEQ